MNENPNNPDFDEFKGNNAEESLNNTARINIPDEYSESNTRVGISTQPMTLISPLILHKAITIGIITAKAPAITETIIKASIRIIIQTITRTHITEIICTKEKVIPV